MLVRKQLIYKKLPVLKGMLLQARAIFVGYFVIASMIGDLVIFSALPVCLDA
jgi:hypothetical protein